MKSGSIILIASMILFSFFLCLFIDNEKKKVLEKNYSSNEDLEVVINNFASVEVPSYSPEFERVLSMADRYDYDFGDYSMNSLYPLSIDYSKLNPKSKELISKKEYRSLFGVAKYLQLSREFELELDLFRTATKLDDFEGYVHEFLTYIEYNYLNRIKELVEINRIVEAKKMAGLAYQRLILYDNPPMYFVEIGDRAIIDRILLYNMIFNDPRILAAEPKVLKAYVDLLESEFRVNQGYEKYIEVVKEIYYPVDVAEYFLALRDFYAKNYELAYDKYSHIVDNSPNIPLTNLALLLKARTLFWASKYTHDWISKEEMIQELNRIEEIRFLSTLKSDIKYYKDSIAINISKTDSNE